MAPEVVDVTLLPIVVVDAPVALDEPVWETEEVAVCEATLFVVALELLRVLTCDPFGLR